MSDKMDMRRARKMEFAKRLQDLLTERNLNQADFARKVTPFMPEGQEFTRDLASKYVNARSLPGPVTMKAIAEALGVTKEELLPSGRVMTGVVDNPPLDVKEIDAGRVFLKVNQVVAWPVALKIMALLRGEESGSPAA